MGRLHQISIKDKSKGAHQIHADGVRAVCALAQVLAGYLRFATEVSAFFTSSAPIWPAHLS